MGFNKRYISKQNLQQFKKRNITELISFIKNPDCIIIEDKYSRDICEMVDNFNKQKLLIKLKEIGFYES